MIFKIMLLQQVILIHKVKIFSVNDAAVYTESIAYQMNIPTDIVPSVFPKISGLLNLIV